MSHYHTHILYDQYCYDWSGPVILRWEGDECVEIEEHDLPLPVARIWSRYKNAPRSEDDV